MLTALLNPTRGWARVAGYDVVKNGHDVRSSVGVLTEQHGLYMRMTAIEYWISLGKFIAFRRRHANHAVTICSNTLGLTEASHRRIGEYSKGMRQKLALARAMMHDPGVLLLDEPTSAMDPESARLVRDEIARLKSSQRTIVICSHNLTEVEALADQIAIIYRGRILLQGTLEELKRNVLGASEYEIKFSRSMEFEWVGIAQGCGNALSDSDQFEGPCGASAGIQSADFESTCPQSPHRSWLFRKSRARWSRFISK